ncbi:hypothetical protein thsrh120_19430 [Rhizobium sp. No.120]
MIADDRHADAQPPARYGDRLRKRGLCILEIVEHPSAALVEKTSFLGEPDTACGTLQQPDAKLMLQIADRLADGGGGKAKHTSSGRKTAEIRSANEGRQSA